MDHDFLKFPDNFWWGASTSAHQSEGGNNNDWTRWELANSERLAANAVKAHSRKPIWNDIEAEATNPKNYISGRAADHYNQYQSDFDMAKQIGINAYRFSIEWSRIQPTKEGFDQAAIEHYRAVIKSLKKRGIEPFVTIWHWTLPLWLADEGGWTNPEVSHYFVSYAALLAREFGADVKYWITLNEPNVYTENSYFTGRWTPQVRSLRKYYLAVSNLIRCHRETYHLIKAFNPEAQVGFAHNIIPYVAYQRHWFNLILKRYIDLRWNFTFLNRVKGHLDYIGVNHYFGYRINYGFNKRNVARHSDMGWELYPRTMYRALRELRRYRLPIIVTENGLPDRADRYRGWYIRQTLKQIHRAISKGVDVRGYFHWSLLDNFEWDTGFWARFGLIEVDYKTMARKIRPSALEYSKIIQHNGISAETKP